MTVWNSYEEPRSADGVHFQHDQVHRSTRSSGVEQCHRRTARDGHVGVFNRLEAGRVRQHHARASRQRERELVGLRRHQRAPANDDPETTARKRAWLSALRKTPLCFVFITSVPSLSILLNHRFHKKEKRAYSCSTIGSSHLDNLNGYVDRLGKGDREGVEEA